MAALQTMLKQPSDLAIPGGEKIWSQCSVVGLHDRTASVNLGPFHHHNYVSKVLRRVWHARPLEPHQLSRSLPDLLVSKGLHIFYEDILNNLNIFIYISLQYI